MFDPLTLAIGAYLVPKIVDKLWDKASEKDKPGGKGKKKLTLSPEQAAKFTRVENDVRFFDPDVAQSIQAVLGSRSAVADKPSPNFPSSKIWQVGPAAKNKTPASVVFDVARSRGDCVLGSLSMVLINTGRDVPMVLVTAPRKVAYFLAQASRSQLAILEEPPRAEVQPVEPAAKTPDPASPESSPTKPAAPAEPAKAFPAKPAKPAKQDKPSTEEIKAAKNGAALPETTQVQATNTGDASEA